MATVADADLDAMLLTLRKQRPVFNEVARAAANNDRVTVRFTGRIDGAEFEGGSGEDVPIVIGADQVMKEFEDALIGAAAGDDKRVQRHFRRRSHEQEARGQDRHLQREDREGRGAGAGTARRGVREEFRRCRRQPRQPARRSEANMERELNEAVRQKMRAQVLEGLFTQNPLELPRQLVEEQIQELQVEMLRRAGVRDAKQCRRANRSNSRRGAALRSACS